MEPATVDPYDDDEDLVWGETDAEKSCRRKRDLLEAELGRIEEDRRTRYPASRLANSTEAEHSAANFIQAWVRTSNDLWNRSQQIRWEAANPDLPFYAVCFAHQACNYCLSCQCSTETVVVQPTTTAKPLWDFQL
jgi:hypothetical protein